MSRFNLSPVLGWAAAGGLAAALVVGVLAFTGAAGTWRSSGADAHDQAPASGGPPDAPLAARGLAGGYGWSATTPATHLGDQYRLVLTNGATAQQVVVRTVIMDHQTQTNTPVIVEVVRLAPGERREFVAVNTYGTANHFSTRLGTETTDLKVQVTVTDAAGEQTAAFNQSAFMVTPRGGGATGSGPRTAEGSGHHQGDGGHAQHRHTPPSQGAQGN
jgi:hypothetical protein